MLMEDSINDMLLSLLKHFVGQPNDYTSDLKSANNARKWLFLQNTWSTQVTTYVLRGQATKHIAAAWQ